MQILEVPSIHGAEIRQALISSRVLVPEELQRRRRFACDAPLDDLAFDAAALEIIADLGTETARSLTAEPLTDLRVGAAILALFALEPGELQVRLERFRARARRNSPLYESALSWRDHEFESRATHAPRGSGHRRS